MRQRAFPRGRTLLLMATVVSALLLYLGVLVVSLASEGPDQTRTGTVTVAEHHRLCIEQHDASDFCAHVDSPAEVADIAIGDCVEMDRSAEEILASVRSSTDC